MISLPQINLAATRDKVAHALSSKEALKKSLQVDDTLESCHETPYVNPDPLWVNEDLEPTPAEKRTWGFRTYCLFYFGISIGNWSLGSSMVGIGLNWWQAILVIFASQTISTIAMSFNSRSACMYHIGYPAVARSVFGFYASYYFVGARAALAAIWYGVQLYTGASYTANILRAIFGSGFQSIPNHIPASQGITSSRMLAFFLFWLVHFFFCFFRPYQLKKFFWFKGFIMIPGVCGVFVYCMVACRGRFGGALPQASYSGKGQAAGWFIMSAINSGMGNTATLITNQPDIARWSRTKHAALWSQVIMQPMAVTLSATFGILSTAGINNKWGLELWNPWDLLDAIQDHHDHPAARFAIFIAAFTFMVGTLGTNIACNMIPFGADLSLLWPRYINMTRGFFIVEFLGFAIVPWKILKSATTFTTFLAGYGLFMASVVAIMLADYFLLTKGNIWIPHLFDPTKKNPYYRFHRGYNIQAIIAYIIGIALPFAGFCQSLGATGVDEAGIHMFALGWLLSFFVSFVCYYIICLFWPTTNQKIVKDRGLEWEELAAASLIEGQDEETASARGKTEKNNKAETAAI